MKALGFVIAACIILAVLKAVVMTLFLAFLVALTWGCLFRPAQVFGLILLCALVGMLNTNPWAFVAVLALPIIGARRRN